MTGINKMQQGQSYDIRLLNHTHLHLHHKGLTKQALPLPPAHTEAQTPTKDANIIDMTTSKSNMWENSQQKVHVPIISHCTRGANYKVCMGELNNYTILIRLWNTLNIYYGTQFISMPPTVTCPVKVKILFMYVFLYIHVYCVYVCTCMYMYV